MATNIYHPRPSTIELNARTGDRGMDWAVYVNTNESLQATITSSIGANVPPGSGLTGVTVNIDVRMLTVSNGLHYQTFTFVPSNDYSTNTYDIKLPEGFLLNVSAYTTGVVTFVANGLPVDPMLGQTWVALSIVAPVNPNQTMATYLTQGYVTNQERIAYPPKQSNSYEDGYPFFRYGSNQPPRGLIYQVPQNAINEITCIYFTVTTDNTASQRQVYISYQSTSGTPATTGNVIIPFENFVAGSISAFTCVAWIGTTVYTSANFAMFAPLPARLRLKAGEFVQPGIFNAGVGDIIANLKVWGNEWLVP